MSLPLARPLLVRFYSPTCGGCKASAAAWEAVTDALRGTSATLANIDITAYGLHAPGLDIDVVPKIALYMSDDTLQPLVYEGPASDANGVLAWAQREWSAYAQEEAARDALEEGGVVSQATAAASGSEPAEPQPPTWFALSGGAHTVSAFAHILRQNVSESGSSSASSSLVSPVSSAVSSSSSSSSSSSPSSTSGVSDVDDATSADSGSSSEDMSDVSPASSTSSVSSSEDTVSSLPPAPVTKRSRAVAAAAAAPAPRTRRVATAASGVDAAQNTPPTQPLRRSPRLAALAAGSRVVRR